MVNVGVDSLTNDVRTDDFMTPDVWIDDHKTVPVDDCTVPSIKLNVSVSAPKTLLRLRT